MKIQKIEIIFGRIFLVLIFLLIICITLDRVSVHFISHRSPIEELYPVKESRFPKPYVMFGGKANDAKGAFNALGYRGKAPVIPKPSEEFRIFLLGGSTVLHGQPPIDVLLEKIFLQNGYNHVRVYNYGVMSSVSGMELARIVFEIVEREPDLIFMYNGGNDMIQPLQGFEPRPGYPFNFVVYENNPLLNSDIKTYPAFALWAFGSPILRALFPSYFQNQFIPLDDILEESEYLSETWRQHIAQYYVSHVARSHKIAEAFGAQFIAFFQPVIYYKKSWCDESPLDFDENISKYFLEMRERILFEVEKSQKKDPFAFVDLSRIYEDASGCVFEDIIHVKQDKKNIIAQALYRQSIEQGIISSQ